MAAFFFSLLALTALAGAVAVTALMAVARRDPQSSAAAVVADLAPAALPLAAIIASTAMFGSLFFSEVLGYVPCTLCWYQRIAMYPLAVILLIAAVRRDASGARRYGIPLAVIGAAIAGYHYLIQQFPSLETGACSLEAPCSAPYVWQYGFVSIPYMALAGFALILLVLLTTERTE